MSNGAAISSREPMVGIVASNTITGECFYAACEEPSPDEVAEFLQSGAMVERMQLREISKLFLETRGSCQIVATGECIARYLGKDIPAWIKTADGAVHEYVGIFSKGMRVSRLAFGQCMVGGLIFQRTQ